MLQIWGACKENIAAYIGSAGKVNLTKVHHKTRKAAVWGSATECYGTINALMGSKQNEMLELLWNAHVEGEIHLVVHTSGCTVASACASKYAAKAKPW